MKESEKGVNNHHDFLHRSVLIGRHLRNVVRHVTARQSVRWLEPVGPMTTRGRQQWGFLRSRVK